MKPGVCYKIDDEYYLEWDLTELNSTETHQVASSLNQENEVRRFIPA